MTKAQFKAILASRPDIHSSMRKVHLEKMEQYCLNDHGKHKISGTVYHLICGSNKGHIGSHEDIDGGIWWKDKE